MTVRGPPRLEGRNGQGSERLPGSSVPGLTLQGSIIMKQIRSKKMGIPARRTSGGKSQR